MAYLILTNSQKSANPRLKNARKLANIYILLFNYEQLIRHQHNSLVKVKIQVYTIKIYLLFVIDTGHLKNINRQETGSKFYITTAAVPTLIYGNESWTEK